MAKRRAETDEHDVLARLSERVEKAITTIQQLRRERDELQRRLQQSGDSSALKEELEQLRAERDEVRARIEKLLANLEEI